MTTIPLLAFTTDPKKNLDIAARFYCAGAAATPPIVAKPTNVPPIPAVPLAAGVAATLLPSFSYESKAAANGTDWHSKFSLLLDRNEKLEAMLGNTLAAIIPVSGVTNVANLIATGVSLTVAGVTTLEQLIYSLAAVNVDVTMANMLIGTNSYLKLSADYTFTPAGELPTQ